MRVSELSVRSSSKCNELFLTLSSGVLGFYEPGMVYSISQLPMLLTKYMRFQYIDCCSSCLLLRNTYLEFGLAVVATFGLFFLNVGVESRDSLPPSSSNSCSRGLFLNLDLKELPPRPVGFLVGLMVSCELKRFSTGKAVSSTMLPAGVGSRL